MIRLVETIHMFRVRYMIDCESEQAAKEIVAVESDNLLEFDQEFLGETIVGVRSLTRDEAQEMHEQADETGSPWLDLDQVVNDRRMDD